MFRTIFALLVLLAAAGHGEATVWLVNEDGTGDAPTIKAAFDSSAMGDTILVGPGTYYEGDILGEPYVYLHSQMGPDWTLIDAGNSEFGIFSLEWNAPKEIIGFTVRNVYRGGIHLEGGGSVTVKNCLLYDCSVPFYGKYFQNALVENVTATGGYVSQWSGSGFSFTSSDVTMRECISAFNEGYGVVNWQFSTVVFECCDVFENGLDDFYGLPDPTGSDGNISADPLFCDPGADDYHLMTGSPCIPLASTPTCSRMGALEIGCDDGLVQEGTIAAGNDKRADRRRLSWSPGRGTEAAKVLLYLDRTEPVRVDVWDVTGRKLHSVNLGQLGEGRWAWTQEELLPERISTSGILFLQFSGKSWDGTLKLPLIH